MRSIDTAIGMVVDIHRPFANNSHDTKIYYFISSYWWLGLLYNDRCSRIDYDKDLRLSISKKNILV